MSRISNILALVLLACGCGTEAPAASATEPPGDDGPATVPAKPAETGTPTPDAGTPPAPESPKGIRFVALGDTGTGSSDQQKVGNTIAAVCKQRGCDFVQLLGDNLYQSGADSPDDPIFQTNFETPYAAVDLDFWVVLGNHDYGGNGLGTSFGKGKNEVDYTAKSKKWKLPSAYWHHVFTKAEGTLEIFGLDTNMALFDQADQQKKDMTDWLAASTAGWKIAAGHHPYKSNGDHGNAGSYDEIGGISIPPVNGVNVKSYLEDKICGKVDLYLSGHDHSRQWLNESCKGTELAVSGAGAKATKLGGTNPSLFESLELGFLYIVIDGKTLTAEFVDESGKTEFTHTITKP